MEKDVFGVIYKITNLINNKIYIGQKVNLSKFNNYWGLGNYIKRSIKKYGKENFKKEILEYTYSKQELDELEVYYIWEFNSNNKEIGYNQTIGNESKYGCCHSDDTKNKIKFKTKERLKNKENHWHYKKGTSPEIMEKIKKGIKNFHEKKNKDISNYFSNILKKFALKKFTLKEVKNLLHNDSKYNGRIIAEDYRKIYYEINNMTLIQHKKHIDAINKIADKKRGRKMSQDFCQKMRINNLGKNNPMYGSKYKWINNTKLNKRCSLNELNNFLNKGWKLGKLEIKIKRIFLTDGIINKKIDINKKEEINNLIKKGFYYGKTNKKKTRTISEETRQKISISAKNKEKIICCYCNKKFDLLNYKRWHGENCKFNKRIDKLKLLQEE